MDKSRSIYDYIFFAFDSETTGFSAQHDKIIELGGVKFNAHGDILDDISLLINPNMPIPPNATQVHGITDAMLTDKPTIDMILAQFLQLGDNAIWLAHNAAFDASFLNAAILSCNIQHLQNPIFDTIPIAKKAFKGLPSYSLENLAKKLQFPANTAHRALDDAYTCMRLFLSAAHALSFMGDITLTELID